MTFEIEHVITGKRETVTQEQWAQLQKLFKGMFKKVESKTFDNLSDEAKKIIVDSESNE